MKKPVKFGKYMLLERINIGGMAEVFKAKSFGVEGFEKLLAIKRILPNIAEDEDFITMFIDEAKISVQLNHANIAQIFDLGKIEDSFFIALEYVSGKDVRTIWDRHKRRGLLLPIPMSIYIMSRVCEGLDYAHRKKDAAGRDLNIVHRDVSPQNVLISYEGEVKIIDFGIAKAANKASKTQAGILKGKFGYMSPEQVRGLPLDRRSDIFASGIILYELLTGERLFAGESDFSTLEKVRNVEILPPSTYNRKIPDTLEKIVLRALSKDPDDRYQTSYDMQEELQRFLILNKTNFARKDLANYMKRAFKADIEREMQRQAAFASAAVSDADDDEEPAPTAPGLSGPRPVPQQPAAAPRPVAPPPPIATAPPPDEGRLPVLLFDIEDDDDEIETVIFDARTGLPDELPTDPSGVERAPPPPLPPPPTMSPPPRGAIGSGPHPGRPAGSMSRPRLAPFTGPAPRPAASDSAPETITLSDSTEPTGPMGGPPGAQPLAEFSVTPFPTSESTVSHDVTPASRPRSRLSLIIAVLAVLAVVVVGLAVFKFLQQRGLLGGGATLIVRINPADAEVSLDGQPLGSVSPNRITGVQPGPHALEARRDNYQPYQESLELRSGEQRELDIAMTFVPATLKLEFEPPDARVSMDGEPIGAKSPITKNDVVPGIKHSFVFEREGYESTTREWGLKAKEERTEKIALKEILFDLEVDSDPSGAKVLLDNALRGRTPTVIKGLKAYKSYQLVLQSDRGEQWNSTIQWDGAPVKKVRGRLEPAAAVSPPPDKPTPPPPKPDRPPTTRRHRPTPTKPLASGLLRLNATPWGKVVIDSKDEGLETPLLKHSLPVGKHKATINFADGRSKTVEFEIKADETTKVIVRPD